MLCELWIPWKYSTVLTTAVVTLSIPPTAFNDLASIVRRRRQLRVADLASNRDGIVAEILACGIRTVAAGAAVFVTRSRSVRVPFVRRRSAIRCQSLGAGNVSWKSRSVVHTFAEIVAV